MPRGADDLLHRGVAVLAFVGAGRCAGEEHLADALPEFRELQRPVVQRARQAKAIIHQCLLAAAVASVHTADLRQRHVALIDDEQVIIREVIEERPGRGAGRTAIHMARIILDAGGEADLADHLQVVARALLEALRFDEQVLRAQVSEVHIQLRFRWPAGRR